MFFHVKELQYKAKPAKPDPLFAVKVQEVLGGQFGEISVMMQYLFQGWNCRAEQKYRDMLLDTGTEEIGHVEMLANMIAQLLDKAPLNVQEEAAKDPIIGAAMGGMNPQHAIVAGLGALPADSMGLPWNAKYIIASGNLLADFRANLNAESQGRLQVCRLYEMTDDPDIRDTFSFMIARDAMHQNQWIAAIRELEAREGVIVPGTFDRSREKQAAAYQFLNFSEGVESGTGSWATGEAPDGRDTFQYVEKPVAEGSAASLIPAPPSLYGTLPAPIDAAQSAKAQK